MPPFAPRKRSSKRIHLPYPTEAVAQRTIKRIHSLLNHDFAAEERIAELQAELDQFRDQQKLIQDEIHAEKAKLAPINFLSIEMLTRIFGFVVPTSPDSITQLRVVCQKWRDAAKQPELWSTLVVNTEGTGAERKAGLFLRKSGHCPLVITYVQSAPHCLRIHYTTKMAWKAWDSIQAASERWRSLSLDFFDCSEARPRIMALGYAPLLEDLRVSIRRQCTNSADEAKFGIETALCDDGTDWISRNFPVLRSLHLETFILPATPGAIFHRLTILHIKDTFSRLENPKAGLTPMRARDVLALLWNCPNLETFTFNAEETYQWHALAKDNSPVPGPMLSMRHLRFLHINCHIHQGQRILEHLTAQALGFASIMLRPRYELRKNVTPTVQFLSRTPHLWFLHIMGLPGEHLVDMRHGFQRLQTLQLDHCPDVEKIIDHLARATITGRGDELVWKVPRLSRLVVESDPSSIPDLKIAALVRARYSAAQKNGSGPPRAMKQVELNQRDMLTGVVPGEMAEFVRQRRFCKTPSK